MDYFYICSVSTYLSTLRPNEEYGIDCLVILGGSVEGVIVAAVPDDPPRLASVNLDVIIMRYILQGDQAACSKPPINTKTKVSF